VKYLVKASGIFMFLVFTTTYMSITPLQSSEIHGKIKVTKGYLKECTGFVINTFEEFGEIQYNVMLTCNHLYKSGEIKRTYTSAYLEPIYDEKLPKRHY